MLQTNRDRGALGALLVALAFVLAACQLTSGGSSSPDVSLPAGTIVNAANSSPSDPLSGAESNMDKRTPPVRRGDNTRTFGELDSLLGTNDWYRQCVKRVNGIDLTAANFKRWLQEEKRGIKHLFVVAINVGDMSDTEIRKRASKSTGLSVDNLPIARKTKPITNTIGDCKEVPDFRSVIRLSLGDSTFDKDGEFTGLDMTRGIFFDCHNPWRDHEDEPRPTPSTSKSPSPSPSTSTSPPGTPGTTPPGTETPKKPNEDAAQNGNAGNGGGRNEDSGPGDKTTPSQPPRTPRKDPPPPAAKDPNPPKVTPDTKPSATPTRETGEQQNDGVVNTKPSSGQPCNPEFQDC